MTASQQKLSGAYFTPEPLEQLRDAELAKKLLPAWGSPAVQLSCEIEGHPLGGGMLKLEVREASRVVFPDPDFILDRHTKQDIKAGVTESRRWRHYAE